MHEYQYTYSILTNFELFFTLELNFKSLCTFRNKDIKEILYNWRVVLLMLNTVLEYTQNQVKNAETQLIFLVFPLILY